MDKRMKNTVKIIALTSLLIVIASTANAASAGMPWETPLTTILNSISGPVAKVIAAIVITATGIGIAAGEGGSGIRKMLWVVMGLSIAFGATSFFLTFLGYTGGATF